MLRRRIFYVPSWTLLSLARGLAFFLGVYGALSLFSTLTGGAYNANIWWIDMQTLPKPVAWFLQALVAVALLAFTFRIPRKLPWRIVCAATCVIFALTALQNALGVYKIAASGTIYLGFPVPFSIFIMLAFLFLIPAVFFGHRLVRQAAPGKPDEKAAAPETPQSDNHTDVVEEQKADTKSEGIEGPQAGKKAKHRLNPLHRRERPHQRDPLRRLPRPVTFLIAAIAVVLCGVAFPLGQIYCFGLTDYRPSVDAVVILGAKVNPNGSLSGALTDRVDTGIKMYKLGQTPVLIMSGGTGVEGVNEAEAMKGYAIQKGVPAKAILVDTLGNNTELTVENTLGIARREGIESIAAVSSFYHMARVKMLYLSAGHDVLTVPSSGQYEGVSAYVAALREIPGWWYYWFKYSFT